MKEAFEDAILGVMLPGELYSVRELCDMTGLSDDRVRRALDRMEADKRVESSRAKRWVEYRIADEEVVAPPKINLLHRPAYRQDGPAWDMRREQVAAARSGKSRHL